LIIFQLEADLIQKDLLDRVDLIAGTSTGGLLALLLAAGYRF
jgi:patatin-like phospholipase/acyl hydrolase